jgi:hypothetical protein
MFGRIMSTLQCPLRLSDFNPYRFYRHIFFITIPSIKFNENPSSGCRADAFGQKGKQTDTTKVMGLDQKIEAFIHLHTRIDRCSPSLLSPQSPSSISPHPPRYSYITDLIFHADSLTRWSSRSSMHVADQRTHSAPMRCNALPVRLLQTDQPTSSLPGCAFCVFV